MSNVLSGTPKIKEDTQASPRPDFGSSYGRTTQAKEHVTVERSQSIATAYLAKNIISDDVAKLPFQQVSRVDGVIKQMDPDPVTRNMAYLLQVSPNLWGWSPSQFKKAIIEWLLFYGNAYIWKPVTGPRQLLILPSNRTRPVFDMDGNLWYNHTFGNGKPAYIPAVEILHLLINPDETGFVGRGVITFARETFGRRLAAQRVQSLAYAQGLTTAAAMTVAGTLDKGGREAYRDAYESAMNGSENAYRLAIFDQRVTKFEKVSMSLADAQFLESINATDLEICNFFKLPAHKLNMGKESYNSNEQKNLEYLQGTLDPILVPWEEGARIRWLSQAEQPTYFFKFVREALLRTDALTRAQINEILIRSGQRSPNEAREKDDYSSYDGGDAYFMSANYNGVAYQPAGPQPPQGGQQK